MFDRVFLRFNPFNCSAFIGKASPVAVLQVRFNCPWHRSGYTPNFFGFKVKRKLKMRTVERLSQTEGSRHILMRRVLAEKHFVAWNWPSKKPRNDRLNYPL
ncbi:hypothetical protein niasHT_009441 [Heterodera trifolii]|uniref:Uncharacterized protein n=1 Tax=Heterodera trifolii TaxID=157864 RepID=A0ABD2MEF3_9BILA